MKTVGVHQPNFLPWLGYFYKVSRSDVFVLLDDVDFQQGNANSLTNRTRIKSSAGPAWITVPVTHQGKPQRIADVMIFHRGNWQKKVLGQVYHSYGKAPHFEMYYQGLEERITLPADRLATLNLRLLEWMLGLLGITTPLVLSGEMGLEGVAKDEKIAQLCHRLEATHYLSGTGARKYNREEVFSQYGVKLEYADYVHPVYSQGYGAFLPGLSALDALFNMGAEISGLFQKKV